MFFNRCTIKGSEDIKQKIQELVRNMDFSKIKMNTSKLNEVCEL